MLLRAIHPSQGDLPPEASRWLLGVCLSAADREEVNRLAAKARAGTLTTDDRLQLDELGLKGGTNLTKTVPDTFNFPDASRQGHKELGNRWPFE